MKAIENQIGGNHYRNMAFQPIELISILGCSFIQGCIIKYISRYKDKNGAQDIKKCIHYAQLAIELKDKGLCETTKSIDTYMAISNFCLVNKFSMLQKLIIEATADASFNRVIRLCNDLLKVDYSENV